MAEGILKRWWVSVPEQIRGKYYYKGHCDFGRPDGSLRSWLSEGQRELPLRDSRQVQRNNIDKRTLRLHNLHRDVSPVRMIIGK